MVVIQCHSADEAGWLRLRLALWPSIAGQPSCSTERNRLLRVTMARPSGTSCQRARYAASSVTPRSGAAGIGRPQSS